MSGKGSDSGDLNPHKQDTFFTLRAIQSQFERMNVVFNEIRDQMERHSAQIEELRQNNYGRSRRNGGGNRALHDNDLDDLVGDDEDDAMSVRSRPRRERRHERKDSNINSIKMKIPSFKGRNDADAYLEWERKVELIFECHIYSEEKKVKLAAVEFTDYAIVWWDQVILNRRRNGERSIDTWVEMKAVMRMRFVPSYYYRELY